MDFDEAKENIQPLATGRNASILQASINSSRELIEQRRELESQIATYDGNDPLEPFCNYVDWIEQSFPSGGKESGLMEVLSKCLERFESEERYYQDRRMIKLFIKYIDNHKDPIECYQQLFNAGIGTMVADFYIAWAYCYNALGQMRKADETFRRGIECRAQPLEELKEAHQHFGFSVSRRTLYHEDKDIVLSTNREFEERRIALSSLRGYRNHKGKVGSIRTGAALKSSKPGTLQMEKNTLTRTKENHPTAILADENLSSNVNNAEIESSEEGAIGGCEQADNLKSANVVRSIIDKARHQENEREPGPWNKVHDKKNIKKLQRQKNLQSNELGFSIHLDEEDEIKSSSLDIHIPEEERYYNKPFKYPTNFVSKNRTQADWVLPVTTECQPDPKTLPNYNKCMIYPRTNREFQSEELRAFYYLKKRGIKNDFTQRHISFWSCNDINASVRRYPNFAKISNPQNLSKIDEFFIPPNTNGHLMVPFKQIYDVQKKEEFQNEEFLMHWIKGSRNDTVLESADMEETMCTSSNNDKIQKRKSLFPLRRSLAIKNILASATDHQEDLSIVDAVKCSKMLSPPTDQSLTSVEQEAPENGVNVHKNSQLDEIPTNSEAEEFLFKTPALPAKFSKSILGEIPEQVKEPQTNKMPFEIYVEENTTNSTPPVETIKPNSIYFDAEETCSTQVFNNFLKAQSVSTPKVEQKSHKRRVGVLCDISAEARTPVTLAESTSSVAETPAVSTEVQPTNFLAGKSPLKANSPSSPLTDPDLMEKQLDGQATNSYSPVLRKQLSTILETSEHHITQSTHSTGVSTKSTISSQDSDDNGTSPSEHPHHLVSKTNISTKTQKSKVDINEAQSLEKTNYSISIAESMKENNLPASKPAYAFDIHEDTVENMPCTSKRDNVNFSVDSFQPIFRFQDDKTDTMPKIGFPSCFAEDKTETIPKIHDSIFSQFQNALSTPSMAPSAKPSEASIVSRDASISSKQKSILPYDNKVFDDDDDTFEFFSKSPPKQWHKFVNINKNNNVGDNAQKILTTDLRNESIKFSTNKNLSQLNQKDTHTLETSHNDNASHSSVLKNCLKDSVHQSSKQKSEIMFGSQPGIDINSSLRAKESIKLRDSFLPDFLKIEENKKCPVQNIMEITRKSITEYERMNSENENTLGISFGNLSKNENKPQDASVSASASSNSLRRPDIRIEGNNTNLSIFEMLNADTPTEVSFLKSTKEKSLLSVPEKPSLKLRDSFVPEFSMIEESQQCSKELKTLPGESKGAEQKIQVPLLKNYASTTNNQTESKDSSCSSFLKTNMSYLRKENSAKSNLPEFSFVDMAFSKNKSQETKNERSIQKSFLPEFPNTEATQLTKLDCSKTARNSQENNVDNSFIPETQEQCQSVKHDPKNPHSEELLLHTTIPAKDTDKSFIPETQEQLGLSKENIENQSLYDVLKHYKKSDITKGEESRVFDMRSASRIFKQNAEPEMFSIGANMIANSTMLPRPLNQPSSPQLARTMHTSQIMEQSVHIKEESSSSPPLSSCNRFNKKQPDSEHQHKSHLQGIPPKTPCHVYQYEPEEEMSIYYKHTPRTPTLRIHNVSWPDDERANDSLHIYPETDLDQTNQLIESMCFDPNVNPFNADLMNAFLDQLNFVGYLSKLSNTVLVGNISRLNNRSTISIKDVQFKVLKLIGEGAYGIIYSGIETNSGKKYALKQERPPNYWEYYICLELQERIQKDEILSAYMSIDYALIGNNASILISPLSPYGSIIAVCNKIKKVTMKNVDEYVVMHLSCELLEIIDHLHAADIIHADVKADNVLVMKKLEYNSQELSLQLIDFGVSIDMRQFKKNQTFTYIHNENDFKCVEMREQRPWSYQLDLYGLAGIIHVMLFGKYMDIEKRSRSVWMPKTHMPRYINKNLWETIFKTLLNIPNCSSMPDLQKLRSMLKEEMLEKERLVISKLAEFNGALTL